MPAGMVRVTQLLSAENLEKWGAAGDISIELEAQPRLRPLLFAVELLLFGPKLRFSVSRYAYLLWSFIIFALHFRKS